jgi:hypothetical protein
MAKTVIEYLGTGTATSYIVHYEIDMPSTFYPHGYLSRDHIMVYDEDDIAIPFTWDTLTGNTITLTHLNNERFFVRRKTPRDELYVEWEDGAILHERNMAAAHLQPLMIIQEIDDGFVFGIEDPDESLIPGILRGIRNPDEIEQIRLGSILVPQVAQRLESIFSWDAFGDIIAVPYETLLELIGGITIGAGDGLNTTTVEGIVTLNVGQGIGMDIRAETTGLAVTQDSQLYAMKDTQWVRPDANDILYDSDNPTIPDGTVQDAIRLSAFLILALTAGVRFRGVWDANLNVPNLSLENARTGDYWRVTVAGTTPLTDPEGVVINNWSVGESALWTNVDHDDDPETPNRAGWEQLPVAERLPADNIDVNQDVHPLALTSQEEHEAAYTWNDAQDVRLADNEAAIGVNALAISDNAAAIGVNATAISANADAIAANTVLINTKEDAFTKNTAFNKNFGTAAGTVCEGDDARLADGRPPTAHTHVGTDITSDVPTEHIPFAIVNGLSGKVNLELSGSVLNIRTND